MDINLSTLSNVVALLNPISSLLGTGHGECQVTTEENASLVEEVVPTQETKKPAPQRVGMGKESRLNSRRSLK